MFTVKIYTHAESDVGEGVEHLFGNIQSVKRVYETPEDRLHEDNPGIIFEFMDGSRSHWTHGRFYVMNEDGATVATYTLDSKKDDRLLA